jgi:hypothetical protein
MTWYFIYYARDNYLHSFHDIGSCFNRTWLANMCSDTTIHLPDSHKLHDIGRHLKNMGLRSAVILQTDNEHEAMILQLMQSDVIHPNSDKSPPILQMILQDPDFARLAQACIPLEAIEAEQDYGSDGVQNANIIQRISLRLTTTVDTLGSDLSPKFTGASSVFIAACNAELNRIRETSRSLARRAGTERKKLLKELLSYATFALK